MSDNNEPESAPAPSNPEETGRPALVERRAEPRCELRSPRHYRIFFTTDLVEGEGTILNIGKDGCKVECETTVEVVKMIHWSGAFRRHSQYTLGTPSIKKKNEPHVVASRPSGLCAGLARYPLRPIAHGNAGEAELAGVVGWNVYGNGLKNIVTRVVRASAVSAKGRFPF